MGLVGRGDLVPADKAGHLEATQCPAPCSISLKTAEEASKEPHPLNPGHISSLAGPVYDISPSLSLGKIAHLSGIPWCSEVTL